MFLISITGSKTLNEKSIPELKHYSFSINDYLDCHIYYSKRDYEIEEKNNKVTLKKSSIYSCDIFAFNKQDQSGYSIKNFMLSCPVYIYDNSDALIISSNIRLFHKLSIVTDINTKVLPEYFVFRYVTPPSTLYKNILSLPLDSQFVFTVGSTKVETKNLIWTRAFDKKDELSFNSASDLLVENFTSNTQDLLPLKDNVSCLLSGGMDSSVIFKSAKDILTLNNSHSTGYPFEIEEENGELLYATTAAEALGSKHVYHKFTNTQFLNGLVDSISQAEMPVVHLQSILLSLLFKNSLSEKDKIILCGQGADGLVGLNVMFNYQHYKYMIKPYLSPLLLIASKLISENSFTFARFHTWSKRKWNSDYSNLNHAIWMLGIFGDMDWVMNEFNVDQSDIFQSRLTTINNIKPNSVLDAFSTLDFLSDVAVTQDIWSQMAIDTGRNVYYSFNPENIIKTANSISWEEKLTEPKRLMFHLGSKLGVPEFILNRPKLGFGVRSSLWANKGGLSEPLLKLIEPVVDIELVRTFQGSDERRAMIYWNWINYGIWKRLFILQESPQDLKAELNEAIQQHPGL